MPIQKGPANLGTGSVDSTELASTLDLSAKTVTYRTIVAGDIASNAITTAKITDANITPAKMANSGAEFGMRNRIINGAMGIWQRGTSISVGSASYTYTADRFKTYSANSATTVSQNTSVPSGFQYSLKLQRPNANTGTSGLSSVQMIESSNCFDLAGQSVTLSFWAKAGANYSGGTLTVQVLSGTVADQTGDPYSWTGLSAFINATQAITTTWTRYSFTATVSASALEIATAISFTPTGTAGADDSIYITGVQLEKGSTATSFDYRPYGTELALCQRYYEQIIAENRMLITSGYMSGVATHYQSQYYAVPKRASPTITIVGTWNVQVFGQPSVYAAGANGFALQAVSSGTGSAAFCSPVTAAAGLTINAEL